MFHLAPSRDLHRDSAMRLLLCTLMSVAALLSLGESAHAAKKIDAEAPLVRPDDAPDGDATGKLKLRLDPGKGWQRFEVRVEHVGADLAHGLWIQDAPDSATFVHVADLDVEDDDGEHGELKLKLDTKKGDALPLGAEQLADLEGLRVEVRHAGAVVLYGDVPALGDGGNGGGKGSKSEAITLLVRPDDAPDADASGRIRLRRDDKQGRQEFDVEAWHVDSDAQHEVFLQDALDAETFTSLGVMDVDHPGKLELEFDTADGDDLPLDAADLADLAGLRLEIRRGDDVVLRGDVPAFGASKKPSKVKVGYGPGPDAHSKTKARLDMRSKPSKGDERFGLMVKALSFGGDASYALFVETGVIDDGLGGELVEYDAVGALDRLGSSSNARFRRKTKKGQQLPLGVAGVADLGGLRFEVRDDEGGVHVAGVIPALD